MKRFFLVSLLVLMLAACAQPQAAEVPAGETESPTAVTPEFTATQPVSEATPTVPSLRDSLKTPTPAPGIQSLGILGEEDLNWDPDANTHVISATNCCGMVPEFVQVNYIPAAQVFGDGRIVWSQYDSENKRQVFEGQLSQVQVRELIQGAASRGFFDWQDLFKEPLSPSDMPTKCVSIQVSAQNKQVCEYYKGAPQAFHDLFDLLASGAGAQGQPYVPERGYLTAYPVPAGSETAEGVDFPTWDATTYGVSLADAVEGQWLEGAALQAAWELINANPWGAQVQEEDQRYTIALQIPGVSLTQPPQPEQ